MSDDLHLDDSSKPGLSPSRAVFYGHVVVTLPVLLIMCLGSFLGYAIKGSVWAIAGFLLGLLLAWLWWSLAVPRWREWAKSQGADEEKTQSLGERSGLVWPKKSIFEKTEIRPRKKM